MVSRYDTRSIFKNTDEKYENLFEERNTKSILQYATANLKHPTSNEIANLSTVNHFWREGDRFWKLAAKYYNQPHLWWVIAWFNRMPTEGQVSLGDVVVVPLPLSKILDYLDL
jgi:nucleoid-associated protein YgaU|tara:strand:+ start:630 stop:968 length:339 start_codon:yes stop_codon:yes gene_type:complete